MAEITKPSEALRAARKLIEPEGAWTQGVFARDNMGQQTPFHGQHAVCWCVLGACNRVCMYDFELRKKCQDFLDFIVERDVVAYNDNRRRTHAEVLDALNRAAALAEAEGC